MKALSVLLLSVAVSLSARADTPLPAGGKTRDDTARLVCGRATLTSRTRWHLSPDDPSVWLEQRIELTDARGTRVLALESHQTRRGAAGPSGLNAVVLSWACIQSKRGTPYLLLGYSCGVDDVEKSCGGEREWFRILDEKGTRLDAGFARQDRRYDALHARLGVAKQMSQGIPMSSLIPDD